MTRPQARSPLAHRIIEALIQLGPSRSSQLTRTLGISQPTFSRGVRALGEEVIVAGRGRATRYAARRPLVDLPLVVPVYEVQATDDRPRHLLNLHPIQPTGFYAERLDETPGAFSDDLPWFLQDLRPAGFLGRLVPRRHPELALPADVRIWSAEHVLRYVTRHGWDLPGAFLLGEAAYETFLDQARAPANTVASRDRATRYPEIAAAVLSFGAPGSSAAGEQPKFLATRQDDGGGLTPALVKFSPPMDDRLGRRVADLLVAEHLAHGVLREAGHEAPASSILIAGGRTFLEVERFDRAGATRRRGVVSLMSLDGAFVGSDLTSWSRSVEALAKVGVLSQHLIRPVRWLELFGCLIGNTDMHPGNLSFHLGGTGVTGLTPLYDMLPMAYAPRQGEIIDAPYALPTLSPAMADIAEQVIEDAASFWGRVRADSHVSPEMRTLATRDLARVQALRERATLLPRLVG